MKTWALVVVFLVLGPSVAAWAPVWQYEAGLLVGMIVAVLLFLRERG